jgi:hypothetical protein
VAASVDRLKIQLFVLRGSCVCNRIVRMVWTMSKCCRLCDSCVMCSGRQCRAMSKFCETEIWLDLPSERSGFFGTDLGGDGGWRDWGRGGSDVVRVSP